MSFQVQTFPVVLSFDLFDELTISMSGSVLDIIITNRQLISDRLLFSLLQREFRDVINASIYGFVEAKERIMAKEGENAENSF